MTKEALQKALVMSKSKLASMIETSSETEGCLMCYRQRTEYLTHLLTQQKEQEQIELSYQNFLVQELSK